MNTIVKQKKQILPKQKKTTNTNTNMAQGFHKTDSLRHIQTVSKGPVPENTKKRRRLFVFTVKDKNLAKALRSIRVIK